MTEPRKIRDLFASDVTRDIPPVVYFHEQSPEKLEAEVSEYIITGGWPEAQERALLQQCRDRMMQAHGRAPQGWLSPWISESALTPDLLRETGYRYTLNWCHDDQPVPMRTRGGGTLWSVPYPQELNDIPMIVARQMDAKDFAQLIVDNFDEMLEQARRQPLVMGIALHPYIVGQPYRLRHLRRALQALDRGPPRRVVGLERGRQLGLREQRVARRGADPFADAVDEAGGHQPAEATDGQVVPNKVLTQLFGNVPLGRINPIAAAAIVTPKEKSDTKQ